MLKSNAVSKRKQPADNGRRKQDVNRKKQDVSEKKQDVSRKRQDVNKKKQHADNGRRKHADSGRKLVGRRKRFVLPIQVNDSSPLWALSQKESVSA